jgi:hypothetical protein
MRQYQHAPKLMKLLRSGPEGAGHPLATPLGTRTPTASKAATPSGLPLSTSSYLTAVCRGGQAARTNPRPNQPKRTAQLFENDEAAQGTAPKPSWKGGQPDGGCIQRDLFLGNKSILDSLPLCSAR